MAAPPGQFTTAVEVEEKKKKKKKPTLCPPQPVVAIIVGAEKSFFTVHKNFISYYSPFFERAFKNSDFVEGQTQKMTMNDVEKEEFGLFANWLYTQKLENEDNQTPGLLALARLWIFADRVLVPTLQNQVMDEIFNCLKGTNIEQHDHFLEFAHIAAEHGDGTSMLAYMVAHCLAWSNSKFFDNYVDELPHVVVLATVKVMKYISWGFDKEMFHVEVFDED